MSSRPPARPDPGSSIAPVAAKADSAPSEAFDAAILLAHGARDTRWLEPFDRLRERLEHRLGAGRVAVAYLDFAPPSLGEAAAELAQRGARRVLVVPVFLSGGGHVARDVPELVQGARARHPELSFTIAGAIGEEPEVVRAMEDAVSRLFGAPIHRRG